MYFPFKVHRFHEEICRRHSTGSEPFCTGACGMGFTKFWRSASDISWEYLLGYLYIYIIYIQCVCISNHDGKYWGNIASYFMWGRYHLGYLLGYVCPKIAQNSYSLWEIMIDRWMFGQPVILLANIPVLKRLNHVCVTQCYVSFFVSSFRYLMLR